MYSLPGEDTVDQFDNTGIGAVTVTGMSVFKWSNPIRKPTVQGSEHSPFCTSPSQLEDVTLDPSILNGTIPFTMGVRSPGQSAPVRGRTMKEYEEQLAQLKKENFNLKLRIYFLEERTSRMGECPDKEVLLNTNIELKVETEALRKERDEKEDLLVQASRLVELTDKQYREQLDKLNDSKEREIGLLKRRIQELEKAMKACTEGGESAHGHELQLEDSNMNLELSRSPSLGGQQDKNRPQEVTEMSQVDRLRGESERTNHLECDLQADQVKLRCQALEAELKQRDHRLEELLQKLKQRGQELAEKDLTIQERDSLIEDNQSQLEQQKKVLGEIQTTLGDNQQQINALRMTLLARDAIIADLEGRLSTARAAAHKLEVRLDATQQEGAKLQEEIETLRSQHRRSSGRSPLTLPDSTQRHLKTLEEAECLLAVKLRETQCQARSGEEARRKLEGQVRDAEERIHEREVKLQRMEEDNRRACLAIEGFMKRSKSQSREVEQLQAECRRKDRCIQALTLEMSQLREGCYKVQARTSAPTVHADMTEEENERLWAEVESKDKKLLELTKDRDSISLEMEKQVQGLQESLKLKESQLEEAEEKLSSATATLQGQDNRITELEEEVMSLREEVTSLREERVTAEKKHQESQTEKTEEEQKLQDKDTEIERLSLELRRKTHNLQELVNKELWNKNREIEKLQARLTTLGERKELEIFSLQQEVTARDFQLKMLQSKVSELGQHLNLTGAVYLGELAGGEVGSLRDERNYLNRKVEELKEKLRHTPERDNDSVVVATLRNEVAAAREEAERAEMWRREAGEVCTHLTRRLEELARFLASLLTSVPAGGKKRRLIERAVENSMELSRSVSASFGATMSAGDATHSVSSCLTSMSEVNVSLLELLAAADEEGEQTQTIARLRAEVETLKQELKQRDGEMNQVTSMTFYNSQMDSTAGSKPPGVSGSFKQTDDATLVKVGDCRTTSKQIGIGRNAKIRRSSSASAVALATIQQNLLQEVTYSESEAWSEPDRNVSLARIGLPEETTGVLRRRSLQEVTQTSESEEETAQETATKPGKRSRAEGDVRRLVTKVRGLEQINDALKSELSVFHQWASQQTRPLTRETSVNTSEGPPMMDKSTSVQSGPVNTAELLREIRRQREKLESSLRHNDQMRVALEGVLSAAVGAGEVSRVMDGVKEVTDRLDDATSYNHALEEQLKLSRDTVSSLEQQLATLTSRLHESDNEVLERKCLLLEMENQANQQSLELHHQIVALEMRLQETEQALSRANTRIQDLEAKESSLESKLRDAEESASKRLQEVDKKLQEAERLKEQFEAGIHCQKEEADRIRVEADARVQEAHDKFKLQESELHRKLANTERESRERQSELERRLNQVALETSQTALERTRLSSDKLRLEQDVRRLEGRGTEMSREKRGLERDVEQLYRQVSILKQQKAQLEKRLGDYEAANLELEKNMNRLRLGSSRHSETGSDCTSGLTKACSQSSGLEMVGDEASSLELKDPMSMSQPILSRQRSEMSDYVSEDQEYEAVFTQTRSSRLWVTVPAGVPRTLNNSSPDLGIESDPGRFSSLEAPNNTGRIQLVTVTAGEAKDQSRLEQENMELKRRLLRTRRTLEETLVQLTVANQRKKQMERAICRQIHKTNHILKTTRSNLEAAASDEPHPSADDRN